MDKNLPDLLPRKKQPAQNNRALTVVMIVIGAVLIALSVVLWIIESKETEEKETAAVPFNAYTYSDQKQQAKFNMLSDSFASFVLGEDHGFYIAMLGDASEIEFSIVCLSVDTFKQFEDVYEFTFSAAPIEEAPRVASLSGYAVEIDEELADFTIEYFNLFFGGEILTSENFDDYFGHYYLDATRVSAGTGENAPVVFLGAFGVILLAAGIWLLYKSNRAAVAAASLPAADADSAAEGQVAGEMDGFTPASTTLPLLEERAAVPHPALGFLGALLGSLVGAAVWILLYRVGFIAGIAGYLAVICALAGYKKFGGGITKVGTVFCILVAMLVLVAANGVSYAWVIADEVNSASPGRADFVYLLAHFFEIMSLLELWGSFFGDLVIGLILALVAGASPIVRIFKKPKN